MTVEIEIDAALVRALLHEQHRDLADLELTKVAAGWDNAIFRLGDELIVRLPHREVTARLIEHEQRWLPRLAPQLPLPIPSPLRVGRPSARFPWAWSVSPWFEGDTAARRAPADPDAAARAIGAFLVALHVPAPADAPENPVRGVPLRERAALFDAALERIGHTVDAARVRAVWERALAVPPWEGPPLWLHGDLHPANIVVRDGEVAAIIDFGDLTGGDPATDFVVAWMMFAPPARDVLRDAAGNIDDHTWERARGWALAIAMAVLSSPTTTPRFEQLGARTLEAVLTSPHG